MSISKLLFGEIALKKALVTKEQIDECLEIQKKLKDMGINRTLGAVMHDKKFLSMVEIKEILREMTGTKDWNAIEGYEILGKLGKGGMGAVYKARHQKLNKIVALKVLPPELAADQEYLNRFMREAQAAAKLNHLNIVQALDVGESYGYHYFVMEYAEGKTVKDVIEDQGTIDEGTALDICEQIASALGHAAKNDLVHRDIKPSNIIVSTDGLAKLLDLGLAKSTTEDQTITQTGVIMGTPFYLSPEQARSEDLDSRSDIYSLGVTLFHMLTGQVPFSGNSAATILYKHIFQEPPKARSLNPNVSAEVSQLVAKMMAKAKEDRQANPDALVAEIHEVRTKLGLSSKMKTGGLVATAPAGAAAAGKALDKTLASAAERDSLKTMPEPALDLAVSGPQAAATAEARTEQISSAEAKKRKMRESPEPAATAGSVVLPARAAPVSHTRFLVAFGATVCAAAVLLLVAMRALSVPPRTDTGGGDIAAAIAGAGGPTPAVAEAVKRVEALRADGKLAEATAALVAAVNEATRSGQPLEAPDEHALARARAGLVNTVKQRADELNRRYDEAIAQGGDSDSLVASIKSLDIPLLLRLVETDRKRLEDAKARGVDAPK